MEYSNKQLKEMSNLGFAAIVLRERLGKTKNLVLQAKLIDAAKELENLDKTNTKYDRFFDIIGYKVAYKIHPNYKDENMKDIDISTDNIDNITRMVAQGYVDGPFVLIVGDEEYNGYREIV